VAFLGVEKAMEKPWKNRWKKPGNRCGNPMKSHGFSGKIHHEGVGVPNLC